LQAKEEIETWYSDRNLPIGVCQVGCGSPPEVKNATVMHDGTSVGSKATYTCMAGHVTVGSGSESTCGSGGQWSSVTLSCDVVYCPELTPFSRSLVTYLAPDPSNPGAEVEVSVPMYGFKAVLSCLPRHR